MAAPRKDGNIREIILNSTIELLRVTPFKEISLSDIAQSADISKGTLYYYFKNKEEILFAITDKYLDMLSHKLIEWVDNKEKNTSTPRLVKYILEYGSDLEIGKLRLYLIGEAVAGDSSLKERFNIKYEQFKNTIAQKLKERNASDEIEYEAWLLLICMDGLAIQRQLDNKDFSYENFIKTTVSILSH